MLLACCILLSLINISKSLHLKYLSKRGNLLFKNVDYRYSKIIQISSKISPQNEKFKNYKEMRIHNSRDEYNFNEEEKDDNIDFILDDFDHILEAITIYKNLHGDVNIPVRFEVPGSSTWPANLTGLRLGKRLEKLLSQEKFFNEYPQYISALRAVGFNPTIKTLVDDWDVIYQALQVYKEVYGNLRVPAKFVVPDEEPWPRLSRTLKLGVRVAAIRSAGRYVKDHRGRKEALDSLGFEWRLRSHTHKQQIGDDLFDQVYLALVHYKKLISEELDVPINFEVPNDSNWPEEIRGLKLGILVQDIRDRDKLVYGHEDREMKLTSIGFIWEEGRRSAYSKKRFDIVYRALVTYKDVHGDLFVPQAFVVPPEQPWSEDLWNLKLGARVNAIRAQGTLVTNAPDRRKLLNDLGFTWELPTHVKKKKKNRENDETEFDKSDDESLGELDNLDKEASQIVAKIRASNFMDEKSFVKYPTESIVSSFDTSSSIESSFIPLEDSDVSSRLKYKDRNVPMKFIGDHSIPLNFDLSRMFEPIAYREIACESIREYMQSRELSEDPKVRRYAHFEGHLTPEEFHKINIRDIPEEDILAMKTIGYRILEFGAFNWNTVIEALRIYKLNYGNIDVPIDFIITEDLIEHDIGFDEKYEDLPLGEAVESIRIGDVDALEDTERRAQLDELEFNWGDMSKYQRYRFVPLIVGLKIYRHLYGFPLPPTSFRVPDEPQWPYWMCDMPLGEWATIVRIQQKMVEEHYSHRKDMLNALEFMWWIPPGKIDKKYYADVI